jgi:hypothetical protein
MDKPHVNGRRWLLAGVGLLYLFSVPWYRAADANPPLLFGLPDWVAVALLCYSGAAVLNAIAWRWTPIDDDAQVDLGRPPRAPSAGSENAS